MRDIDKNFGKKRGNGILNTTISMVTKTIYENRRNGRASHINKILGI